MKLYKTLFSLILASTSLPVSAQPKTAIIRGHTMTMHDGDTAKLTTSRLSIPFDKDTICYISVIKNNQFSFRVAAGKVPLNGSITFQEKIFDVHHGNKLSRLALHNFYIEYKDDVTITEAEGKVAYSGRSANKYRLLDSIDRIENAVVKGVTWDDPHSVKLYFKHKDSAFAAKTKLLKENSSLISQPAFLMAESQIAGDDLAKYYFFNILDSANLVIARSELKNYSGPVPRIQLNAKNQSFNYMIKYSGAYTFGLREKFKFDSCTYANKQFSIARSFSYFMKNFSGPLRERLLLNEIYLSRESTENAGPYIPELLSAIKDPEFKKIIISIKGQRVQGSPAFEFSLSDSTGRQRTMSEFKGQVVVMDFWFTGCGVCLRTAPLVRKAEEIFKDRPVIFLTINDDKNRELWLRNLKTHRYTSEYSLDLFTDGKAFNSNINKHYDVTYCPVLILIDKNGKLTRNPVSPEADGGKDLIELIKQELNK